MYLQFAIFHQFFLIFHCFWVISDAVTFSYVYSMKSIDFYPHCKLHAYVVIPRNFGSILLHK